MSSPFAHSLVRPDFLPWSILATVAAKCIGEREDSQNRSPFIRRLWRETWGLDGAQYYEAREPWCSAFVCWCINKAMSAEKRLNFTQPLSPSVHIMRQRLQDSGAEIVPWKEARKGDVITYLPVFSHIGIVEECVAGGLITIEGNTNQAGSREGDGVYRKQREDSLVARCDVWRLPVRPSLL